MSLKWDRVASRDLAVLVRAEAKRAKIADALFCVGLLMHQAEMSEDLRAVGDALATLDPALAERLETLARAD